MSMISSIRTWWKYRPMRKHAKLFRQVVGKPYLINKDIKMRLIVSSHYNNETHFMITPHDPTKN